jgi:hypothetical protein
MGVSAAMSSVQDEMRGAPLPGFVLERGHQQLADSAPAEPSADDQSCAFAARLVALDEVLLVEGAEARDLAVQLHDQDERRGVDRDPLQPGSGLVDRGRVLELAEKSGDCRCVPAFRSADRPYGGGGGGPPGGGGASSSTYVLLVRPHPPP